jgi:hypothetical protein
MVKEKVAVVKANVGTNPTPSAKEWLKSLESVTME